MSTERRAGLYKQLVSDDMPMNHHMQVAAIHPVCDSERASSWAWSLCSRK